MAKLSELKERLTPPAPKGEDDTGDADQWVPHDDEEPDYQQHLTNALALLERAVDWLDIHANRDQPFLVTEARKVNALVDEILHFADGFIDEGEGVEPVATSVYVVDPELKGD